MKMNGKVRQCCWPKGHNFLGFIALKPKVRVLPGMRMRCFAWMLNEVTAGRRRWILRFASLFFFHWTFLALIHIDKKCLRKETDSVGAFTIFSKDSGRTELELNWSFSEILTLIYLQIIFMTSSSSLRAWNSSFLETFFHIFLCIYYIAEKRILIIDVPLVVICTWSRASSRRTWAVVLRLVSCSSTTVPRVEGAAVVQ